METLRNCATLACTGQCAIDRTPTAIQSFGPYVCHSVRTRWFCVEATELIKQSTPYGSLVF